MPIFSRFSKFNKLQLVKKVEKPGILWENGSLFSVEKLFSSSKIMKRIGYFDYGMDVIAFEK